MLNMHALNMLWCAHNEDVFMKRRKRRKYVRDYMETVNKMPDNVFIERFRLNKKSFQVLCQDIRRETSLKGTAEISLEIKVLCTLSFLATGSYQKIIGVSHHLTQRTVSRCIKEVVEALNHKAIITKWILFPQTKHDRDIVEQKFQSKFGLPGVIGCIDCIHIGIAKPYEEPNFCYNAKGYYSLNVQMVCDSDLFITNVNGKFGGDTEDSYIWYTSKIKSFMQELHQKNEQVWLLGDSQYQQSPWLMIPIVNAVQGSKEELYAQKHAEAHNSIKSCFRLLKTRWQCLLKDKLLHYQPVIASRIISACCLLHNIALKEGIPQPSDPMPIEEEDEDDNITTDQSPDSEPGSPASNQSEAEEEIQGQAILNSLIDKLQ